MRRPLSLLLMVLMLLSQQAVLQHVVGHSWPARVSAQSPATVVAGSVELDDHACQLCTVAAQLAAALPVSSFQAAPAEAHRILSLGALFQLVLAAPALAFRSRAPPIF